MHQLDQTYLNKRKVKKTLISFQSVKGFKYGGQNGKTKSQMLH